MLFNVETDRGAEIIAYVVPDGGGTTPSITLQSGGKHLLTMEANDNRGNLVAAGRHATGQCGFTINESVLPNLTAIDDLEILETTTEILVYRRRPPGAIEGSFFRLETHLLPLWRLDDVLKSRFQFWYKGIERHGRETSTQIFCMNNATSSYVSGRLLYKNFEYYLTKGVRTFGIIRDPYLELAERLIVLKNIGSRAEEILGQRDAMTYAPLIEALSEFELFDDTFARKFARRMPDDILALVSNPLVRQLTAGTPDEMPTRTSIATALEALAAFDVLGLRSEPEAFAVALAEMIGIEASSVPDVKEYPRILDLGERLRANHDIEGILERDLEVFHAITSAFETAHATT